MMKTVASRLTLVVITALCAVLPLRSARAVSYASGVRNTGGAAWEFVLNEAADNVSVVRNGGNTLNLGALTAGRHTFDMTGFTTFDIKVAKSAPVVWAEISNGTNKFTRFEQGSDVIVQTNPAHPLFGTIYVNNDRAVAAAGVNGRPMGDGVYALTADMIGVNLPTRAALTDPTDVSAAKAPGWNVGGVPTGTPPATTGDVSAWRLALDGAGNIIAGDWSDVNGGIKWASADLSTGGALLINQNGTPPLPLNGTGQEVHGSIVSRPQVTGSIGNNLVIMAMDEDYDLDGSTAPSSGSGNHIWRWNVGNVLSDYDQPPTLVVNGANIPAASDFRDNWLALNSGVLANAIYSPQHNKWYMTENRADGNQAGLIVVTPDGVDGNTPTLEWSSLEFTIANGFDGHNTVANNPNGQDIFRSMGGGMTLSPDGTKLYAHRTANASTNPVTGTTSADPGAVLIIPLDANGIPNLTVNAGVITNLDTISTASNGSNGSRRGLALDAAGNVYTTNNVSELLQVWSPGGNWLATTTSAGGFTVAPLAPATNNSDFDNDGDVDGADLMTWQKNLGATGVPPGNKSTGDANGDGSVNGTDLGIWKGHYNMAPSVAAAGAVPEPGALALAACAVLGLAARRRQA